MSTDNISEKEGIATDSCANCGVAAVNDIKLKPCPHCDLVHYCCDQCQQDHQEIHKVACIERAAEIRDEILFLQPESSHLGDCPICFLPMPLSNNERSVHACCGTETCNGCIWAYSQIEMEQGQEEDKCPFCRTSAEITDEESMKRMLRRAEANEPKALEHVAQSCYDEEDYENAYRYWTRAVELGNDDAHYQLGMMYFWGEFVERDTAKSICFWEQAAIKGHAGARYALGLIEASEKRLHRAVRHWIISASLGCNESIQELRNCYKGGHVSKDDFAKALHANEAALDAMKSPQREEALKIDEESNVDNL